MVNSNSTPRVTIITATYNYSSVLHYAIGSALAQTLSDFEYLVIGDGCTDDTADVVAAFNDPRLHFYNLETNSGSQSIPNNKGLELARGEYIAYLGHDDLWMPNHLQALISALDSQPAGWAHPLAVMIGPPGSDVHLPIGLVKPGSDVLAVSFTTSGVVHRRDLVMRVGNWKAYNTLEIAPDLEFQQRIRQSGVPLRYIENLSVLKFPSAWRKNVYRERPSHEQATYFERMRHEPDFLQKEMVAILKTSEFHTWEKWQAAANLPADPSPTAPPGSKIEGWRRFRGLEPKTLSPRPWWDILRIRAQRAAADITRPLRKKWRG